MKSYIYTLLLCLLATVVRAQLFPDFTKAEDYFSKTGKRHRAEAPPLAADPETGILMQPISVKDYFESDTVTIQTWYKGSFSDQLYYLNNLDFKASKSFEYLIPMIGEYFFRITSPQRACYELLYLNTYSDPVTIYSQLLCPD